MKQTIFPNRSHGHLARVSAAAAAFALLLCSAAAPARGEEKFPFPEPRDYRELPESALIETTEGAFEIEFYRREAPLSVRNFQYLVENNRYDGVAFHRYQEDFMIQGGDVTGTGKGGPGYTLPPEISKVKHAVGSVGWARLPNEVNPERRSNGSQFYISLNKNSHLNGYYTIFAHVTRGMEVVEQLRIGDKIVHIRLPKDFRAKSGAQSDSTFPPRQLPPPPGRLPVEEPLRRQPPAPQPLPTSRAPQTPPASELQPAPQVPRPQLDSPIPAPSGLPPDSRLSDGDTFAIPPRR